jgi:murein DD-endopeptidase MepM/ murein hydrolase activator NlpD
MTGWATGPHLHFEFKAGGEQRDPATIAREDEGVALDAEQQTRLASVALDARTQLAVARSLGRTLGDE